MEEISFESLVSEYLWETDEKDLVAVSMFDLMFQKDPNSFALKLDVGSSHDDIDFRTKCVALFFTLVNDFCLWNSLSVSTQSILKSNLLMRLELEQSTYIHNMLSRTVLELAASLLPDDNWPELLPFLYHCVTDSSSNKLLKDSVFLIFCLLGEKIGEKILPWVRDLHSLFLNTLNDHKLDLNVRITAMFAVHIFIQCTPSSYEKERFQDLLPGMMKTLTDTLMTNGENQGAAHAALGFLIQLAKNEPRFLRLQLVEVVNTMFEIAEAKILEDKTRRLAIEFLLTLVEAREKVPGMMKKLPRFIDTCFTMFLNLILDIKDEPSWHSAEGAEMDDHLNRYWDRWTVDNYLYGAIRLRRFSKALGGNIIAPIAIEQLSSYVVAPEWEKRHAALMALAQIAKGSSKVMMIKYLEQVVNMVLHSFRDSHPRVRWAAINAIVYLSTDFCPDLQEQYHNQVLPELAAAMDDFQNPRVQACAATASVMFLLALKEPISSSHIDGILNKLFVLLQNDNQMVQDEALYALGSVAYLYKEHFQKYYDFLMPYLRTILVNANDESNQMLQSKVALAAGKEKFRDDLKQVMEVLKYSLQESHVTEYTNILCCLKASYGICVCIGKEFLPYMRIVMPYAVECARLEPDKTVSSDKLYDSMHKVMFGGEMICIYGSDLLEGKSMLCSALKLYAHELGEDFYPWIPKAASILIPLLKFYIHSSVRERASCAMVSLLRSAKLAVEKGTARGGNKWYLKRLPGRIILALGDALYLEPETKLCEKILQELNNSLNVCQIGGSLLNEYQVHRITDGIKHVIIESSRRKGKLREREKSEDFDAEEAELLREERELEEKVFYRVGCILLTLIKTFKAAFLPFLDELSSYLMPMTGKDKTAQERSACVNIFNKLVEECNESALKYYNICLPFLLDSSNDENPVLRENALYGLRLCAEYGGFVFKPFIGEALSRINVVITHLHALAPENEQAYHDAVLALGQICQFHRESIDSTQIIPAWLNCLPIRGNMVVHDQLCSMVERSDRELLGPKYEHFPKILSVFAEVLCAGKDLATEEMKNRMINLLRNLQKTVPVATWASAWSLLLPQQEMELESILSPKEDANLSSVQSGAKLGGRKGRPSSKTNIAQIG
ncbi:PREDICTED: importin-5-like isoform X1 [Nicotiana attenuata]|uniref:importin-5-like isoform X1 n=1 Tax=Nicotiana attenuata TaxID=49451 RepID=UPI0009057937|nr:PREDICTED: importin-5-like isoform X1 [Nicotiana attenuata]